MMRLFTAEVIFISYLIMLSISQGDSSWQSPLRLVPSVFVMGPDADLSEWEIMKRMNNQRMRKFLNDMEDFSSKRENAVDDAKNEDDLFLRLY